MPHRNHRHLSQQLLSNNPHLAPQTILGGPHPQPPQPPPAPTPPTAPPLITDTLTACLDVNGTYICTSYSPRCYIIQKVTPTSLTVTPATATPLPPGQPPPLPHLGPSGTSSGPHLHQHYATNTNRPSSLSLRGSKVQHVGFSSSGGCGQSSTPTYSSISSQSSSSLRAYAQPQQQPQQHHQQYAQSHHQQRFYPSGKPNISGHSGHVSSSYSGGGVSQGARRPDSLSKTPQAFEKTAPPSAGGIYMNGEIGSSVRPGISMPTMVYPQPVAALAPGPHFPDSHAGMNGVIPQEFGEGGVEVAESGDVLDSSSKRGFNSNHDGGGAGQAPLQQTGHHPDLPIEELKRLLLAQLEYYFSSENLSMDKYLVTQMDQDHYVAIATLATFNMVKKLTSDIDLVTEVLRESKVIQVHPDGKRARPISQRTVVILRGIPSSTNTDEIKNLFNNENCPKCTGCEFAFNDSWYISFETDDDAMQAYRYIREDVREFKGQPIMARIKSKPTTLLSQGMAIGAPPIVKNGFTPPGVMPQFMATAPPFVPAAQQSGASAVPTNLFAPGQQVPNVFPAVLPGNYGGYGSWPTSYFEVGSVPMYGMNGLQPQASPGYGKSAPINPRSRNLNNPIRGVGPRRTMSSGSDTQVAVGNGNGSSGLHQQQQQGFNQSHIRKTNGAPTPLLGVAPQNLVSHASPHPNHHHSGPIVGSMQNNQSGNGRPYNSSYSQPSVSHSSDNYHYASRPYRGSGDSRPRSSLSSRRPTRRDDDNYDYNTSSSHASTYRSNPSTRSIPPAAVSPQASTQVAVTNQNHQIDLDLEGSAFPPLPGSANASNKNGDAHYEGRLSDVVKGVKNISTKPGTTSSPLVTSASTEKEDSSEIVVSAAEPGQSPTGSTTSQEVVVVSAASPQTDEGNDILSSHQLKKEYREIGVGGADEVHDGRSTQQRTGSVSSLRQTADKSTRTDETLLNGDQQSSSTGIARSSQTQTPPSLPHNSAGSGGGNPVGVRKAVASQGGGSRSPIPGKRGVPPFQSVSTGVGPDVPYTSTTSPNKIPTSQTNRGATANPAPRGPQQSDNSRPTLSFAGAGVNNSTGPNQATEKDAFPAPNFVKVPTLCNSSAKPFSGATDHYPKEGTRGDTDQREPGQGDGKKVEDCSNSVEDCPVRLSYAQVAQSRKDQAQASAINAGTGTVITPQPSSPPQGSSASSSHSATFQDERKGRGPRDKDRLRNQRMNGDRGERERDSNNPGRDRDRNYRNNNRGYRSRVTSEASDSGSISGGKKSGQGLRSPK